MIIDGRKVLYSVKAKKLVYPEIPTEGLVCYLDARGKTNTDKHKGTLIDLSGNGNHGTLQNFNFTEESGYVKDLPGGGLKFDGVDDVLNNKYLYSSNSPHTVLIDFYIPDGAKEQGVNIELTMGFYIHAANNFIYSNGTNKPGGDIYPQGFGTFTKGRYKILITYDKDFRDSTYFKKDKISKIPSNEAIDPDGIPYTFTGEGEGLSVKSLGRKTIYNVGLWNRVLTDEEITKLMEV